MMAEIDTWIMLDFFSGDAPRWARYPAAPLCESALIVTEEDEGFTHYGWIIFATEWHWEKTREKGQGK